MTCHKCGASPCSCPLSVLMADLEEIASEVGFSPEKSQVMTFEELIADVADAAREGAWYELPASDLLSWLEDLQEHYEAADSLAQTLGTDPSNAPSVGDLAAQVKMRLRGHR